MAEIVVMPALGNTVESCLVTTWQVSVGDAVTASTVLAEIETDKSAMDVPAGVEGTVLALLAEEGDEVPVKAPFVIIGAPGDDISALLAEAGAGAPASAPEAAVAPVQEAAVVAAAPAVPAAEAAPATGISPRARALALGAGVPLAELVQGTGPHGRIIERDVAAVAASRPTTAATRGADVSGVTGTGLGGRVTMEDLSLRQAQGAVVEPVETLGAVVEPVETLGAVVEPVETTFPGAYVDTPLKGVRKLIAERMLNALATSAQLTYTSTAPATRMLALRKRFKATEAYAGITLGDLVCFATVQVLKRHANLNAHLEDNTLRTFSAVHLGLAVDTPRGLLVPTIRNADRLTLRQLSDKTKELAEAARSGKIDPELLSGATFTVSNLGSFGIENFTPIINVPQTGILGVNTISPRVTIKPDGTPGVEERIGFSLTADHQVVDGADAGRFLADLCAAIADIDLTVMG